MNQYQIPEIPEVLNAISISNYITSAHSCKRIKIDSPNLVTAEQIVNVAANEQALIQRFAGEAVAPAWFAPAIQAALAPAIQAALAPLIVSIENGRRYSYNASSLSSVMAILPLSNAAGLYPDNFPDTTEQLQELSNHNLNLLIEFYNLPNGVGNNQVARNAKFRSLKAHLGIR